MRSVTVNDVIKSNPYFEKDNYYHYRSDSFGSGGYAAFWECDNPDHKHIYQ